MARAWIGVGVLVALVALAEEARAEKVRAIVGFKGAPDAALVEAHGGEVCCELRNACAVQLPPAAVSDLRAHPDVAYVEEDGIVEAFPKGGKGSGGKPPKAPPPQSTPWGVARVDAPVAGNTGAGVKVAVIDTGIDLDHPDLADNVKGAVDFVKSTGEDDNGHGTHVAGTIGAIDNSEGVVGVAPGVSLYAVKVLDRRGSGRWSDVAQGIEWSADNGMQVANMSLGGSSAPTSVRDACIYAQGKGVVLVAASGNGGDGKTSTTEIAYPAAYESVIAVGATTQSDGLAWFSNTGSHLEVSAPGVDIPSTWKGGGYRTLEGTSMASPHAAGICALLWVHLGEGATGTGVRDALTTSRVRDLGPGGRDNGFGFGIVDWVP